MRPVTKHICDLVTAKGPGEAAQWESSCHTSRRTWVWVLNIHIKSRHMSIIPVLGNWRQDLQLSYPSQVPGSVSWLSLSQWKAHEKWHLHLSSGLHTPCAHTYQNTSTHTCAESYVNIYHTKTNKPGKSSESDAMTGCQAGMPHSLL